MNKTEASLILKKEIDSLRAKNFENLKLIINNPENKRLQRSFS